MYSVWSCPLPDGGVGEEMVLGFDEAREKRILIIPPLFEEANRLRHQIVETMRKLHSRGVDCFLPDLPGWNESLDGFENQSLAHWRVGIASAVETFSTTAVLAVRSGCWLVPEDSRGWLYAPPKPQQILRNMLRARILSAREAGREEITEELRKTGRERGITLAGWPLGPELFAELETEDFAAPPGYSTVQQMDVGGTPLWLRAENDFDLAQATALASIVATSGPGA